MSMWAEVRALQTELYNVQTATVKNKLSERNCIAIIQRLMNLGLLDVIFSCDGKEYITPRQLEKDILDELYVCGGRVAVTDLAQTLNVDYNHVDKKVTALLSHDITLSIHYGELISKQFFDNLAVEVNEALQETGLIPLNHLSREVSLPVKTLAKELVPRVGDLIQGTYNKKTDTFYTTAFVDRQMAKLRGACSAATRPIQLGKIMESHDISSSLGHNCVKEMIAAGRLQGQLQGQSSNPVFIPSLYTSAQHQWADSFYKQNGYITFEMMSNKGIDNTKNFVSRLDNAVELPSGCVNQTVLSATTSMIEEILGSGSYIETIDWVYGWCNDVDITTLLRDTYILKSMDSANYRILPNMTLISVNLLNSILDSFNSKITEKVKVDILNPQIIASLKKFDTVSTTLPEVKTKKGGKGGKKGKKGKRDDDQDDFMTPKPVLGPTYLHVHDIEQELERHPFFHENEPKEDDTLGHVSELLKKQLDERYCKALDEEIRNKTKKSSKTQQQASEASINTLYNTVVMCEKGLKVFEDNVRTLIEKHIIKTIGMDLVKSTFCMLAEEYECLYNADSPKLDIILPHLPKEAKPHATSLITSLNGGNVEEFLEHYTNLTDPRFTQLLVKKLDKKKERNMVFSQKQSLLEQLKTETRGGELLNIACNLIFIKLHSTLLHAPGRCMSAVVKLLSKDMSPTQSLSFDHCLSTVVEELKGEGGMEDEDKQQLRDLVTEVLFGVKEQSETSR